MCTRMLHPLHGATHAYGQHDIDKHKALGWVVEAEISPPDVVSAVVAQIAEGGELGSAKAEAFIALSDQLRDEMSPAPEKRKPGRPAKAK